MHKTRESNIELLRIIAMLLVMVLHANFNEVLPSPSAADLSAAPASSFMRFLCESLAKVSVNVFILISGWFGIKAKLSRMIAFLFQIYFISIFMYVSLRLLGLIEPIGITQACRDLLLSVNGYWFIKCYIILYLFAPVLNAFVEKVDSNKLGWFLVFFFAIEIWQDFVIHNVWFNDGFSPLSFMGLYLLARYMRLYPNKFTQLPRHIDLLIYAGLALFTTCAALVVTSHHIKFRLYGYSSPFVILSAVYLFLFFSKLNIKSKFVNWMAASSFAVYLAHIDPNYFGIYCKTCAMIFHQYSALGYWAHIVPYVAIVFIAAILIDQLRIAAWRLCSRPLSPLLVQVDNAVHN